MTVSSRACELAVAASLLLLGCRPAEPAGQVLAIVNGEEITVPELNTEARARGLMIGDDASVRNKLLGELIDRKLLVQMARKQKLDRTPEYVLSERRSDEILLAQELVTANAGSATHLTSADLAYAMKANPYAFDQRMLIEVDELATTSQLPAQLAQKLTQAVSLGDAASILESQHIPYSRRVELWDSASLSPELTERIVAAVKNGRVTVIPGDEGELVAQSRSTVPRPTPPSEREEIARGLLQSRRAQDALEALLKEAKSSATIHYQASVNAKKS